MKKLTIIFLSLVLFFTASAVFAAGPFNGQNGDCPDMGIGVYPNNIQRDGYGCWTAQSVSADAGDTINVSLWYHNNTNSTLNNVKASLVKSPNSGSSSNYTFSGNMYSSQGNTSLGSVSLSLSSSQTLTYQSAHWMKDKQAIDSDTDTAIVSMNNGAQASLGSVPPGWNDYGQIIVVFKVGTNNNNNNNNSDCDINYFRADGSSSTSIEDGDSAQLTWDTDNCSSVYISPSVGSVNDSGSKNVYPNNDTTYTLKAYDYNGSYQTRTVQVYIDEEEEEEDACEINYFDASRTSISSGQSVVLSWDTDNCDYVNINGVGSNLNTSGSRTIYPQNTTTYTLRAYGDGYDPSDTVRVNVSSPVYEEPVYNNCAVTTIATNAGTNSVTLNGLVNGSSSNTYFEYGKTVNLGSRTSSRSINSGNFSETITGLSSNTIYFYRLVSNCGNGGISYGAMDVFQTGGSAVVRTTNNTTVIRQGTTVVGTISPIMLKIENRYQSIRLKDDIDYVVTYKNIGRDRLTDSVLQVVLPKGITFLNSSDGTYSKNERTLTVYLGDLDSGEEGVIYLEGLVDTLYKENAQIVTTAILVYTSPKDTQENAIAYVLNNPNYYRNSNNLSSSVFFSGFFGFGLIDWLILIIIILLIILVVRKYYYHNKFD